MSKTKSITAETLSEWKLFQWNLIKLFTAFAIMNYCIHSIFMIFENSLNLSNFLVKFFILKLHFHEITYYLIFFILFLYHFILNLFKMDFKGSFWIHRNRIHSFVNSSYMFLNHTGCCLVQTFHWFWLAIELWNGHFTKSFCSIYSSTEVINVWFINHGVIWVGIQIRNLLLLIFQHFFHFSIFLFQLFDINFSWISHISHFMILLIDSFNLFGQKYYLILLFIYLNDQIILIFVVNILLFDLIQPLYFITSFF